MRHIRKVVKQKNKKAIFLLIAFLCVNSCGCSDNKKTQTEIKESTQSTEKVDTVKFDSIKKPKLFEKYATVYFDNQIIPITWGDSQDSIFGNYFWTKSSLPGFGYTILIEIQYFEPPNSLSIKTNYGVYQYEFSEKVEMFQEHSRLVDKKTGEDLIQLDPLQEKLIITDSSSEEAFVYTFSTGTLIVE